MANKQSTVALIDGDIIVYRCAFAAERNMRKLIWSGGETEFRYKKELNEFIEANDIQEYTIEEYKEVEPLDHVLSTVKATISGILGATKPKDYRIFLTEGECFRHRAATIAKYKGNRDKQQRPRWYEDTRKYLTKYYDSEVVTDIEADDALADNQTEDTVICSIDKDLLQVPGKHFNWVTGKKILVSPETARLNRWMQVLTGDSTDNIPGIKGIGPVNARKLLAECTTDDEMRAVCVEQWAKYMFNTPPDWVAAIDTEHPDPIECTYVCANWNETTSVKSPSDVVDEVLLLITVGR